jgi:hypothetical protein
MEGVGRTDGRMLDESWQMSDEIVIDDDERRFWWNYDRQPMAITSSDDFDEWPTMIVTGGDFDGQSIATLTDGDSDERWLQWTVIVRTTTTTTTAMDDDYDRWWLWQMATMTDDYEWWRCCRAIRICKLYNDGVHKKSFFFPFHFVFLKKNLFFVSLTNLAPCYFDHSCREPAVMEIEKWSLKKWKKLSVYWFGVLPTNLHEELE